MSIPLPLNEEGFFSCALNLLLMNFQSLYSIYLSDCASDLMYTDGHRDPSPEDLLAHLQNEIASIYEDGETIDDVDRIFIYTPDQAVYLLNYLERK